MIKEIIQSVQRVRLFDVTPYLLIPHTVSCEEEAPENKRSRLKKRIKYQFCCNFHRDLKAAAPKSSVSRTQHPDTS